MMAGNTPKDNVIQTTPDQDNLKSWIDHYLNTSRDLLEMDEMLPGIGFVHTESHVFMIPAVAASREEKNDIKETLREVINKGSVRAAFFVGKVWLKDIEDLDRILGEAIVVEARDANEHWWVQQRYQKELNGAITFGGVEIDPVDETENPNTWFAGCRFVA